MKIGKIVVLWMTAVFLAGALFVWSKEPGAEAVHTVTVVASGGTEVLRCRDGNVYLPGFGEISEDGEQTGGVRMASSGVPALFLDVRSGAMDHIHQEKGNSEGGSLRLYEKDGSLLYSGNFAALKGRGSSTWNQEKKPYNLELSAESDLLGMGKAKKWALLANAMDPSQLRNKIVYDFAETLGMEYTPESRWVNLYLNGEYAGLYLLCERIEVHPERASLAGENYFLVSKEWEWRMDAEGESYVQLNSRTALRLRGTNMEPEAVAAVFQSAENAILAEDGVDPVTGKHWQELIDVDSWVMKYLVEEVFGNVDGGTLSQYFYYDGGKIYAGPVWDYDLTMGNTFAYPYPTANMFYVNRPGVYATVWYPALCENDAFYERMVELYEQQFRPALEALIESGLEDYSREAGQAATMNAARWGDSDPGEETVYILEYLKARMDFLDSIWLRGEEYVTVMVVLADDTLLRYELRPGEVLSQLPEHDEGLGWYDTDGEIPFDIGQPVFEDTSIYWKRSDLEEP